MKTIITGIIAIAILFASCTKTVPQPRQSYIPKNPDTQYNRSLSDTLGTSNNGNSNHN